MFSHKKRPSSRLLIISALLILNLSAIACVIYLNKARGIQEEFPINISCRGNMIVEARYDDLEAKMVSSLSFRFLNNNKILISLSGVSYLRDKNNSLIKRDTILRNVYYDYVHESKDSAVYSLTSSRINSDAVDNVDARTAKLLLLNSFFITGHTDTLLLRKYDDNTMLIETTQSPVALCVFSPLH